MKKKFIPCRAVSNNLGITFLPKELESIHKIEAFVPRTMLFKKIKITPKGKLSKKKVSLSNIPVNEVYNNPQSLPRPEGSNSL